MGVCFPIGAQRGRELSSPWRERNVLVGPDAQLVWSSLLIKDVLSSIVMTQIGSIPHGEVTGPHTGPRKPRDTLDWTSLYSVQFYPSFSHFLVNNTELDMQIELESQSHGQTTCWGIRGTKGVLFN